MTSGDPTASLTRHRPHQRSSGRSSQRAYSIGYAEEFDLRQFATPANLRVAKQELAGTGGWAPGLDGWTYHHLSDPEFWSIAGAYCEVLLAETYRPGRFRKAQIPKPDGSLRPLLLAEIMDRVVLKALLRCLTPMWRGLGIRQRGVPELLADLQRAMRISHRYVLAIDDIKNCYPSVDIDAVLRAHHRYLPDHLEPARQLRSLLARCLPAHDERGQLVAGLAPGSPYSPAAMEVTLHVFLDCVLEAQQPGFLPYRYVDNVTYLVGSVEEGRELLRQTDDLLGPLSMTLKGQDGDPKDVREKKRRRHSPSRFPPGLERPSHL